MLLNEHFTLLRSKQRLLHSFLLLLLLRHFLFPQLPILLSLPLLPRKRLHYPQHRRFRRLRLINLLNQRLNNREKEETAILLVDAARRRVRNFLEEIDSLFLNFGVGGHEDLRDQRENVHCQQVNTVLGGDARR